MNIKLLRVIYITTCITLNNYCRRHRIQKATIAILIPVVAAVITIIYVVKRGMPIPICTVRINSLVILIQPMLPAHSMVHHHRHQQQQQQPRKRSSTQPHRPHHRHYQFRKRLGLQQSNRTK